MVWLVLGASAPAAAGTPTPTPSPLRWFPQRHIPGIADDANPPILVADQNRTVHAFFSQWNGGELAVFYNQWTLNGNWSRPIDILLSPNSHQAIVLGALLDDQGIMHVAFFGGTAERAEIYYSYAPATEAGRASAWAAPQMVGAHAISPVAGMLTGDGKGNLYILYDGGLDGNGLYFVASHDGGTTWTDPESVFLTGSASLWISPIYGTLDSQGRLHVVWTTVNKVGNGKAVYYARLEADHKTWSAPLALQTIKGNDYETDWTGIVSYNNELMVMYNYGFPPQRWMRRSSDGGRIWSAPVVAFASKGEYGLPVFLIDSSNTLRVVLGNRTMDEALHGMWYSTWRGDHWDALAPIVSGPRTADFDPSRPQAIVGQGNVLLVTWRNDPGAENNSVGIWYSFAKTDAPELPAQPLPTVMPTPVAATATATLPASTTTPPRPTITTQILSTPPPLPAVSNPMTTLLIAVVPVVLLVSGVVVFALGVRR